MSAQLPESPEDEQLLDNLASTIGTQARAARMRLLLTQADVAQKVGLVPAVYGRLERGRMLPSVRTLHRLATALGTSPDSLMGHPFRPEPPADSPSVRLLVQQVRRLHPRRVKAVLHLVLSMR
ncbi:DNA-binding protein [Myxococcus stipitatus DSM 14675]|uniref:DNA-binding protein n=1 Tax=Myxococcus stipitatus (strain DSM 14675 / JCM 12634 / Mx s8) TaxID=1278073 RepID=L7U303_MYXSD|nr:helix-turn-helix transcriptional regulator [Myxococcus stipitatus]AGC43161.1 DNA-binding protein [Myxococcus stipitatus DSM 14675]